MRAVSTLGSHCALQVLKGAKDEGFRTLLVTLKAREGLYRRFRFIDEFVVVERFQDILLRDNLAVLKRRNAIVIPHGTFVSDLGVDAIEGRFDVPVFGNRRMLRWEADRDLKERLVKEAGLTSPKTFRTPEEIDRLVIAKQHGAKGGHGYFLAEDAKSFAANRKKQERAGALARGTPLFIQEYVLGVPVYFQFFYSALKDDVELLGIDRRYETTADALGRLPAETRDVTPSYMVVGNFPMVIRESLLDEVYRMGERFVEAARRLAPPGMIGPFCIEGVYRGDGEFVAFEFSARIVAGTNLYVQGSPYSALLGEEPVSMGRRIAMEIKEGIKEGRLDELLT
ncbi:MAG: formate--phosphoribosylaminoimidazolecarboxamide ligase [Nitrososphaerota archaeon]|nr:formate--phosphoribosylaminoimidazolecarboxamide ligase [Nitrososphaerota archaeon]MDG7024044.1 formate--phosphoribosylaminoimidazolecarboxamide ligase [Nitrososphaerota archaeon]